ncbi:MAG: TAXI family TRAP transporter solute-binding subunit [Pseudomonadota bacterium]
MNYNMRNIDAHKRVQWGLIFLVSVTFLISQESFAAERKALTWGTTASTSGAFVYFVTAAKILNEKIPEINLTVRATGGGVHNLRLLEKNEIDIGAVDLKAAWEAIHGEGVFKGKPFPDLRALYVNTTNPYNVVVSEKSGIKDIYGLEGKPFTPGGMGSSTEAIAMDILRILGIHPKIRHSSMADALEAMKNGVIVGWGKTGISDSMILETMSVMKIRILSFTDEDINNILKNSVGLKKFVVPAGTYPGVQEYKTTTNLFTDFVRKDFPAELAYKIVKTIWENRAEIAKHTNPGFLGDRIVEETLEIDTNYLHPGAIKYYRELGQKVPRILLPPEMGEK